MIHRAWGAALVVGVLAGSAGCDARVSARAQVLDSNGKPIPNAVLRFAEGRQANEGVHTDDHGCASISRAVRGFVWRLPMQVEAAGYEPARFNATPRGGVCALIRLQAAGSDSTAQLVPNASCPCGVDAGTEHAVSARFKIKDGAGQPLSGVEVRNAAEPKDPWFFASDDAGCVGISWIVGLQNKSVPLALEKAGYSSLTIDAPTMQDQCFAVELVPEGSAKASRGVPTPVEECECTAFSGTHGFRETAR